MNNRAVKDVSTLACRSCNRLLVEIITFHDDDNIQPRTKILAICPYCGDESWAAIVNSPYKMWMVDDSIQVIDSITKEEEDGTIVNKLVLVGGK